MREADFRPVDHAIARALDDGEDVVVLGVEEDALDGGLNTTPWASSLANKAHTRRREERRTLRLSRGPDSDILSGEAVMSVRCAVWRFCAVKKLQGGGRGGGTGVILPLAHGCASGHVIDAAA